MNDILKHPLKYIRLTWINYQYLKFCSKWNLIDNEIQLRKHALKTTKKNKHTEIFIKFLKRRIEYLYDKRDKYANLILKYYV